jgi:flagellar hook assembly protein FlgD
MNYFWICFLSFCFYTVSFSQIGTGQWRLHVSTTQAIDVAAGDGLAFCAFPSGLIEYDLNEQEKTVWTNINGLSDVGLSALYYDPTEKSFWIGYENGNIDKLKNNVITNIPAIKLASIQGNKTIHSFQSHNGFVYVSFGLGITKINPVANEVVDTYYPNSSLNPILQTAFFGDSIFALTEKTIFRGGISNIALADPSQWISDSRFPNPGANSYNQLLTFNNKLYVTKINPVYGSDSVFRMENNSLIAFGNGFYDYEIKNLKALNNQINVVIQDGIVILNEQGGLVRTISNYSFSPYVQTNSVGFLNGQHFVGDNEFGFVLVENSGASRQINVSGPPNNSFYSLTGEGNKVGIAGGTMTYTGFTYNKSGAYIFEDEEWMKFDMNNQNQWVGKNVWDINSVSINPKNNDEFAFGSYSFEPLAIVENGTQITKTYNELNSPLEKSTLQNNNIQVSDVQYDADGNLWVLNGYSDEQLKVRTPDGLWYSFGVGNAAKSKHTERLVIDYNGNKWFYVRNTGVFGFNDNGTLDDPSDDQVVFLNSGENTGALPSNSVSGIAVDFDNEIWIGTDQGFSILYNSVNAFGASNGQYNTQRIKLEFEGNVEYILGNTWITDIEVDGGNRKWIATANSGLFLLSADGLEILQNFTMENSPLISNEIQDIQLNNKTGELFIITPRGLLSYRTDASYEDPDYADVQVFPNPHRPEMGVPITIQGIKYNSDVKITDVAGNLVYQTTSNGGTAAWDGKNIQGERVKTGVYLIWTASNNVDAKGRKVGSVLVVN